jgi:hypothetical protein
MTAQAAMMASVTIGPAAAAAPRRQLSRRLVQSAEGSHRTPECAEAFTLLNSPMYDRIGYNTDTTDADFADQPQQNGANRTSNGASGLGSD